MVRKTYKFHDITIPQANDPTKTISKDNYISPDHHSEDGMIGFDAPDSTLVTNVLTPIDSVVVVRGEGASADVIDHIVFSAVPDIADKDLLWLIKGAEAITINHNTGSPPANSGPVLLLSQANKKMIGTRMVLLQRQGSNFQEIAFDGIVGDGGILVEDDNGNAIIVCGSVASAVNHLKVTNAATGNDVIVEVIGTDTDIGIVLTPKGTGIITALNTKITNIRESVGGALALIITGAASIVNHFEIKPSITTADLELNALGTDTDIGIKITPKGIGRVTILEQVVSNIREATGKAITIAITAIASAVNYIEFKANIATADPEIQAKGSDTNVGIKFVPKGTGAIYGVRESWGYPLTDEDTAPTTGVKFVTEPAPYNMTIDDVIAGLTVAGTGAVKFTIDVLKENSVNADAFTTILSTKVSIDASEFTSTTAAVAKVISVTTWEKGRRLQLKIETLDTDGLARGAKVVIVTHATAK